MSDVLTVQDLAVTVEQHSILQGINLVVRPGELHAIMGPNGSGKSTLAATLMGHPSYEVIRGSVLLNNQELLALSPDKRAQAGLFLAFQYPHEIDGVQFKSFLRQAYNALHGGTSRQLGLKAFNEHVEHAMSLLGIESAWLDRSLNVGFSGGEKKRAEVLQLAVLQPKVAILDEIDSGLDIDALKAVCEGIARVREANPDMAIILITHYQRILNYLKPDVVHIMQEGKVIRSGDFALVQELEKHGYSAF